MKNQRRLGKAAAGLLALALIVGSAASSDVLAGEGRHQRAVLGVGLGLAPTSSWQGKEAYEERIRDRDSHADFFGWPSSHIERGIRDRTWEQTGLVLDMMAGLAFTRREMFAVEFQIVGGDKDARLNDGIATVAWYHYFTDGPGTVFTRLAYGPFIGERSVIDAGGYGFQLGMGIETVSRLQFLFSYTGGKIDGALGEYKHSGLSLIVRRLYY